MYTKLYKAHLWWRPSPEEIEDYAKKNQSFYIWREIQILK